MFPAASFVITVSTYGKRKERREVKDTQTDRERETDRQTERKREREREG